MFRRISLTLLVLLVLFTITYAEEIDSTLCNSNLKIQDHSKALQFQIYSNFQIGQFQGSTISLKRHLSKNKALRYGITLNGSNSDIDGNYRVIANDSLSEKDITDNSSITISITTQYLLYHSAKYSYIFYGLGPVIRYSISNRYDKIHTNLTGSWELTNSREQKSSLYNIGLSFVFGSEVFISKSISIHGEYSQELVYEYRTSKDTRPDKVNENILTGYSFGNSEVAFGCSFYW
ncbi:hypothetical protein KKA87_03290 [bacterium]|nr:hypothetical protein [bacterium]MBU1873937.1 hypothetical protein [bacterium]